MKKYLTNYIVDVEKMLEKEHILKEDLDEVKLKIMFFQHERLIHLIVTLFFSLFVLEIAC